MTWTWDPQTWVLEFSNVTRPLQERLQCALREDMQLLRSHRVALLRAPRTARARRVESWATADSPERSVRIDVHGRHMDIGPDVDSVVRTRCGPGSRRRREPRALTPRREPRALTPRARALGSGARYRPCWHPRSWRARAAWSPLTSGSCRPRWPPMRRMAVLRIAPWPDVLHVPLCPSA